LTARRARLDSLPGGIPAITPVMVASACKGLRPLLYYYALTMINHDKEALSLLRPLVRQEAATLLGDAVLSDGVVMLADMALEGVLVPQYCNRCHGRKYTRNHKACPVCKGSGLLRPLAAERKQAERAKLPRAAWRKQYGEPYKRLVAHFQTFENEVSQHLFRALYQARDPEACGGRK